MGKNVEMGLVLGNHIPSKTRVYTYELNSGSRFFTRECLTAHRKHHIIACTTWYAWPSSNPFSLNQPHRSVRPKWRKRIYVDTKNLSDANRIPLVWSRYGKICLLHVCITQDPSLSLAGHLLNAPFAIQNLISNLVTQTSVHESTFGETSPPLAGLAGSVRI